MSGYGKCGLTVIQTSWIPAGRMIEVDYGYRCVICSDTGIQMDDNGEPLCHCDCVTGEAMLNAEVAS